MLSLSQIKKPTSSQIRSTCPSKFLTSCTHTHRKEHAGTCLVKDTILHDPYCFRLPMLHDRWQQEGHVYKTNRSTFKLHCWLQPPAHVSLVQVVLQIRALKRPLGVTGTDGRILLKWILSRWERVCEFRSPCSGFWQVTGSGKRSKLRVP
jgi:hypothetical protein